jgi:hypothetical protein
MDLDDIDAEDVDIKLFKNAAEIGKASATNKKYTLEARAAIEAAARRKAWRKRVRQRPQASCRGCRPKACRRCVRPSCGGYVMQLTAAAQASRILMQTRSTGSQTSRP